MKTDWFIGGVVSLIIFPFIWTICSYFVLRIARLPQREARRYAKKSTVVWLLLTQYVVYRIYFSAWAFFILLLWTGIYIVYIVRQKQLFLQPVTFKGVLHRFWQGSFTWYTFGYLIAIILGITLTLFS